MPTARRFAACWTRETTSSRGSRATAWLYFPAPPQAGQSTAASREDPPSTRNKILIAALLETDRNQPSKRQSRLWRAGGYPPVRSARLVLATRRDPRPLRRRIASSSRHHPADVSDRTLCPWISCRIYGLPIKIGTVLQSRPSVIIGAYSYHFWMAP